MSGAFRSVNPATGVIIGTYETAGRAQIEATLARADSAFGAWRRTTFAERSVRLRDAGAILRARRSEWAKLMAREMGKPLSQGKAEADKCTWVCDYYAQHGAEFLKEQQVKTDAAHSFVTFQPLGVLLAVMPWNFPFWQVFRCAAPALMAGNTIILKHASNVPGCAQAIETIFREARMPEGAFTSLLIESKQVGDLIDHPVVKAVTLTGSVPAGQAVAARAGRALKKTVLELGGSDPYLVLEDADIAAAARACAQSRLINCGQSCIAAKRFMVVEPVRKEFEERFVAEMESQKMGDPLDEGVTVGPLARRDLRDEVHSQVTRSIAAGAKLLTGGQIPDRRGAFYPPTVLTDVTKGMPAFDEELFGPVAAIVPVPDAAAAIQAANDSIFGLGAAVFTKDRRRGEQIAAEQLEAGCCFVNSFVKSDPRLPFGGVKQSGYGRELSVFGIHEFVNIKSVWVE